MTDEFVFDVFESFKLIEPIAYSMIRNYKFDPEYYIEDIAQDVKLDLFMRREVLADKVTSIKYLKAVIARSTYNALQPLLRERSHQTKHDYEDWWIKDNLDKLLDGISIPTYAFQECKLTGTMKQVIENGYTEEDLAVQADFNAAYLSLTDKQQEALYLGSKTGKTASERSAHSKALNKLWLAMNRANNKEEQD